MPQFKKSSGGRVYLRGIDERVTVGDVVDASAGFAEYLRERSDFQEYVDDETIDADDADDAFDVGAWLEQDYQQRADRVREGEVDEHLDVIDEHETSSTVRDAIGQRRAELEG